MNQSLLCRFFSHPRNRWILGGVFALFIYWAGTGFSMPNWYYNVMMSEDGYAYDEYAKGGYGGGYAPEAQMVAMEADADFSRSMNTAASILPPFPEEGSGDLTKYEEVGARIIKTGALSMDVKNTNDALATVSELAGTYGGFLQSSNTWLNYNDTLAGSATLRVESIHFETAMEAIKQLATVVRSESVSGQDVTEEFIDIQARMETLKAEEAQYLEVLKKATTVEEILQVNDYLGNVRSEIESTEGRLQYLENKTSFSTITVDVTEEASVVAPTRDWKPVIVMKQAINQLVVAGQGLVNFLIWLVIFGVPAVVVLGGGWFVIKRVRDRK